MAASTLKAMLWYWWHNPYLNMQTSDPLQGMPDMSIKRNVPPHKRQQIKFEDLDMRIDPYSMQHATPQQRMQQMNGVMQTIAPMMPMLQQQGVMLDINAYLKKTSQYLDMPDLSEIFSIQEPPAQEGPSTPEPPSATPATTTRNYTRHSSGAASSYGKDTGILNMMKPAGNGNGKPQGG